MFEWAEGRGRLPLSTLHRLQRFISQLVLRLFVNKSFGKQLKMKYFKGVLFLLLTIVDVSTNAQEVTCEGEQLINVDILIGHPGTVSPYKPGHILVFRCTDVTLKMYGQRTIECLSSGKWDNPYPKCGVEDLKMERFPDIEGPVKHGYKLRFSCNGQGLILKGQREITCQPNGEWSSPFPKCEEAMCVANLTVFMRSDVTEDGHPGPEVSIRPGHTITLSCVGKGTKLQGPSKITCLSTGEWSVPFPKCVRGKCERPPQVDFADTTEVTKPEYNSGERVEYICFNKYTLVQDHPYSKYLTCEQGAWRGNIKCLKPCSVTVEEMDKRGIELRWRPREKIFSTHGDRIIFACQWGKDLIGSIPLIQYCNDGVINLPEVCETRRIKHH
ncbi:hypothetical protein PO909_027198 [Leuciscus waleckii]